MHQTNCGAVTALTVVLWSFTIKINLKKRYMSVHYSVLSAPLNSIRCELPKTGYENSEIITVFWHYINDMAGEWLWTLRFLVQTNRSVFTLNVDLFPQDTCCGSNCIVSVQVHWVSLYDSVLQEFVTPLQLLALQTGAVFTHAAFSCYICTEGALHTYFLLQK